MCVYIQIVYLFPSMDKTKRNFKTLNLYSITTKLLMQNINIYLYTCIVESGGKIQ